MLVPGTHRVEAELIIALLELTVYRRAQESVRKRNSHPNNSFLSHRGLLPSGLEEL